MVERTYGTYYFSAKPIGHILIMQYFVLAKHISCVYLQHVITGLLSVQVQGKNTVVKWSSG